LNEKQKPIAIATRVGCLYYLNCQTGGQQVYSTENKDQETKPIVWHHCFGHLGTQNLQKLAKEKLVDGFDYNSAKESVFCELCAEGKQHRSQFPSNGGK